MYSSEKVVPKKLQVMCTDTPRGTTPTNASRTQLVNLYEDFTATRVPDPFSTAELLDVVCDLYNVTGRTRPPVRDVDSEEEAEDEESGDSSSEEEEKEDVRPFAAHDDPWLSDEEIADKLKQFEKEDRTFHSLQVWPRIPMSNVLTGIIKKFVPFLRMTKNGGHRAGERTKFGVVFNTQRRGQGRHWVLVFVDTANNKREIEYIDPLGLPPSPDMTNTLCALSTALFIGTGRVYTSVLNKNAYQTGASQCGMFALFYIAERLAGKTMHTIVEDVQLDDQKMQDLKTVYFRSAPEVVRKQNKHHPPSKSKGGGSSFDNGEWVSSGSSDDDQVLTDPAM
jgi:hypothetical protein